MIYGLIRRGARIKDIHGELEKRRQKRLMQEDEFDMTEDHYVDGVCPNTDCTNSEDDATVNCIIHTSCSQCLEFFTE